MVFEANKAGEYYLYEKDQKDSEERKIIVKKELKEIYYFTEERIDKQKYQETAEKILPDLFGETAENLDKDSLIEKWAQISIYVKQYDFYQEEEMRLAFDTMEINSETGKEPRIGYRNDEHVMKPYLDIQCKNGWPITSVMVGPGYNQDVVYKSIKFFLDHGKIMSGALVTDEQWKEQIRNYLCSNKKICSIWRNMEKGEKVSNKAMEQLYSHWKTFSRSHSGIIFADIAEIMKQPQYCKYFESRCLTRSGIVVEKSSIPYIY